MKLDPVEHWVNMVCASHSDSIRTRYEYKSVFKHFCELSEKTPTQILKEYEESTDRDFKKNYAQLIQTFISYQYKNEIAPSTISSRVGIIKSFFKYNNLPLGFIPNIKPITPYHNRDITHDEIKLILDASRPRERAFYVLMAQSGLRPNTICNLRYENIKEDFEKNHVPCKIDIPQEIAKGKYHSYFTFVGEEAVNYLKAYLSVRRKIRDQDFLFLSDDEKKKLNPKSISKFFAQTVQKLHEKDLMNLKQKKESKPHDVRLYNLRKWFRKYANQAGFEFVQFWMGHTVNAGQDEHYRPRDVDFHRKLYEEKAMPHLRIETPTPTKRDEAITALEQENEELRAQLRRLETSMEKIYRKVFRQEIQLEESEKWLDNHPEEYDRRVEDFKEINDWLDAHPEEQKRLEEMDRKSEEYLQYLKEHPEVVERNKKWLDEQWIRLDERREMWNKINEMIKKSKEDS